MKKDMKESENFYVLAASFYYTGGKNRRDFIDYMHECEDYGPNTNLVKLLFNNTDYSFKKDDNQRCLLDYITMHHNSDQLLKEILQEYRYKFSLIQPDSWNFIFTNNNTKPYSILESFYNKDYVQSIFNPDSIEVSKYHNIYLGQFYNEGKLDDFFTIDNLKQFHNNPSCSALHSLLFLEKDRNQFRQFMFNSSKDEFSQKSSNGLIFEDLLYKVNIMNHQLKNGSPYNVISLKFNLPKVSDLEILIKIWGIEKTSEIVSDYLCLQKEYLSFTNKEFTTTSFKEDELLNIIDLGIELKNCGSTLCMGLTMDMELTSYLIITGAINKEDLLVNLKKENLHAKAHHHLLNSELEIKEPIHKNRKLKL